MSETLLGVMVGGALTLCTTITLDSLKERRQSRRAARLVAMELVEVVNIAREGAPRYPFPMKSAAWDAYKDQLLPLLSGKNLLALSKFYMQNDLVEKELIPVPAPLEIRVKATDLAEMLKQARTRKWRSIYLRLRIMLRRTKD